MISVTVLFGQIETIKGWTLPSALALLGVYLILMARYPTSMYPGWLRLILTWIIPVGIMTTVPAQALSGNLSPVMLIGSLALAIGLFMGSSTLFHIGLRRYASASS